jgi:hypothetical protein
MTREHGALRMPLGIIVIFWGHIELEQVLIMNKNSLRRSRSSKRPHSDLYESKIVRRDESDTDYELE